MATVWVSATILDQNVGGHEAACDLAKFTKEVWLDDTKGLVEHDIGVSVEVKKNHSGYSPRVNVYSEDIQAEIDVYLSLTDEHTIWEIFCNDPDI